MTPLFPHSWCWLEWHLKIPLRTAEYFKTGHLAWVSYTSLMWMQHRDNWLCSLIGMAGRALVSSNSTDFPGLSKSCGATAGSFYSLFILSFFFFFLFWGFHCLNSVQISALKDRSTISMPRLRWFRYLCNIIKLCIIHHSPILRYLRHRICS